MAKKTTDKRHLETWESFRNNIAKSTPVDLNESQLAKRKRIEALEADPEKWFAWYFPSYYTAKPAPFHIAATKRIVNNPEWLEVRSWSRELAKSARTMMEALYLSFTKKKKVWLMISNTEDNAKRLLLPYKNILESNNRIINDYGVQRQVGKWEDHEFTTKFGFSFRALGAGQSPRGTRNDAARPDGIIIDDFDTDEKCRNKDRVKADTDWIQEAVIPTRSVSVPLLVIINGNIIHKYCTITIMGELADVWDKINLTDKKGNPTWAKNTAEMIHAMFYNSKGKRKISKKAEQKEYYNNPSAEGDTLTQFLYGKCPPLKKCEKLVTYVDPSPSNSTEKKSSSKAVVIVGLFEGRYYGYKVWLGKVTNSIMVNWIGQAYNYLDRNGIDTKKMFIENNSLQNPHFQQVIKPLLEKYRKEHDVRLPVREDKRKKADKFERLENMKDDNDNGDIIFNEKEKENPMMIEMEDEWLGVSEKSKEMDGPDAFEGAKTMIDTRVVKDDMAYASGQVESRRY
ncbi:hypothetical protein FNJ88_06350 [Chryseobacterium sp. SNU WT5]|uniref:hypothetical protein n=1 Tax=Chryseobacterium sp. SNU WT5 TaxID=2594269 RepID=UPI00117E89F9|nr:hypothetical protein [Chryseobacterium sp. SNU WT5]QDP85203.1 hypothetical protein FNJ88_06350 [Chryseobacterium sp. SNU WT5]